MDPNKKPFGDRAKFSLCGVFLYKPDEQVDNTNPSCKSCLRYKVRRQKNTQQLHQASQAAQDAQRATSRGRGRP